MATQNRIRRCSQRRKVAAVNIDFNHTEMTSSLVSISKRNWDSFIACALRDYKNPKGWVS